VKILINLQVGSVREKLLATPFAIESKAVFAQVLPGNHRGGRSLFSVAGFFEGADQGIYSTRIDFQLGTNEADGSLLSIEREEGFEKKRKIVVDTQVAALWLAICSIGRHLALGILFVARPCFLCLCKKGARI